MMPAAVARHTPTTDDVIRAGASSFVVQVRYKDGRVEPSDLRAVRPQLKVRVRTDEPDQ